MSVTEETFQLLRGWSKSSAPLNMSFMLATAETSQPEMLPLKLAAP